MWYYLAIWSYPSNNKISNYQELVACDPQIQLENKSKKLLRSSSNESQGSKNNSSIVKRSPISVKKTSSKD